MNSRAVEILKDLSLYIFEHPVLWRIPFVVARKLKALGGRPEDYFEEVEWFAKDIYQNPLDFLAEFESCWDRVNHPETGADTLALAFERAQKEPVPLPSDVPKPPRPEYATVYSLCHQLAADAAPDPFFLPRPKVAQLIGAKQPKAVTNIVRWLEKHGLIVCVDDTYCYGRVGARNRCKKYALCQVTTKNNSAELSRTKDN